MKKSQESIAAVRLAQLETIAGKYSQEAMSSFFGEILLLSYISLLCQLDPLVSTPLPETPFPKDDLR